METIVRIDGSVWFVVAKTRIEPAWTGEYMLIISPHGQASSPDERVATVGLKTEDGCWKEI